MDAAGAAKRRDAADEEEAELPVVVLEWNDVGGKDDLVELV